MSEMIERIAKIISGAPYPSRNSKTKAERILKAMREPTEAMIEASNREWDGRMSHRSSGAWQAMIDAALVSPADRGGDNA